MSFAPTITMSTARVLYDDPIPHAMEFMPPSADSQFPGFIVIDNVRFRVVPDPPKQRRRLRAVLFPGRWWK